MFTLKGLRKELLSAVKQNDDAREQAIKIISENYNSLASETRDLIGSARYERLRVLSDDDLYKRLLELPATSEADTFLKREIEEILVSFAVLLEKTGKADDATYLGGRSGTIRFLWSKKSSGNLFLDSIMNEKPRLPYVSPNKAYQQTYEMKANALSWELLNLLRTRVIKPKEPSAPSAATGTPKSFQRYLREQGRTELFSFERWSKSNNLEDNEANRLAWQEELEEMRSRYKRSRFESSYCKTGDASASGMNRIYGLLQLSTRLHEDSFRSSSGEVHSIYQGVRPFPSLPPVDFDTLLREFIEPLVRSTQFLYNIDAVNSQTVNEYYRNNYAGLFNAEMLESSIQAATYLFEDAAFRAHITNLNDAGGATPHSILSWLESGTANDTRSAIISILSGIGVPGPVTPSPVPNLTFEDFVKQIELLCLTGNGEIEIGFPEVKIQISLTHLSVGYLGDDFANADALKNAIDLLVKDYEQAWRLWRSELATVQYWREAAHLVMSPFEFKCYLYLLTRAKILNTDHGVSRITPTDETAFLSMVSALEPFLAKPMTILTNSEMTETSQTDIEQFTEAGKHDVKAIVGSYYMMLDSVLSNLHADLQTQANDDGLDENELYERWKQTFEGLLQNIALLESRLNKKNIVLKLTPRKGAYGETRRGKEVSETRDLPRTHPNRVTRSFQLEQLHENVYNQVDARCYLRQHYGVSLRHKGYGIGTNLYSMSLLPEEEQTIVMKSFKDTTITVSESSAENIFEEKGTETSSDFAQEIASEHQKETSHQSDWSISNTITGSYPPYVKGKLDTNYNSQSAARDFAKNTNSVTNRLAETLSAKRKVTVDLKREQTVEEEQYSEINTERKIRNPNKAHTLTFNWFQMTRKYAQEVTLDDIELVYSSGFFPPVCVYVNGDASGNIELPGNYSDGALSTDIISPVPTDLAKYLPPNAVILIVAEPYTEIIPMSQATSFLATVLNKDMAMEVASQIWGALGFGEMAPDGLGVLAFSRDNAHLDRLPSGEIRWLELYDSTNSYDIDHPDHMYHVPADAISLFDEENQQVDEVLLPNLDLRYKISGDIMPARYIADGDDEGDVFAVPRLLASDERVVATNGVFCDAMVGNCTALEDYLERHRDLDLIEKKLQVAASEIDFEWEVARNGLIEVSTKLSEPIQNIVNVDENSFQDRLELEKSRLEEQKTIHDQQLEKRRLEEELERIKQQVEILRNKASMVSESSRYEFDVPDDTTITLDTHIRDHCDKKGGTRE